MKRKRLYQNLGKLFSFLFFTYLFFLPLFRGVIYPTERALFSIILALIISIFLFRESLKPQGIQNLVRWKDPFLWTSLLLLIACFIQSYLSSAQFTQSLVRLLDFVQLFALFHISRFAFERKSRRQGLFQFLFALSLFHCALGIGYSMGLLENSWWEKPEFLSGTFVNHNHFAGFLELMLFLQIGMILSSTGSRLYLLMSLLGVQTLVFFLTMSRGGWISFGITLLILSVILIGQGKLRILGVKLLSALTLGLLLFLMIVKSSIQPELSQRFDSFFEKEGQFEFMDFRLKLYRVTLEAIEKRPIEGYGAGSYSWEMPKFRPKGFPYQFDFAHNDWLQFAMELGIPITFVGLLFCFWILFKAVKRFRSMQLQAFRFEELGLLASVLCLFVHSLVDFNLHIFSNAAFISVYLGILAQETKDN